MENMITLFHAPLGYRHATQFLFKKALRSHRHPDYSSLLYLAPTPLKVDDAQKVFHALQDGKCYIPPELTTISRLARRLFAAFGAERLLPGALVPIILSALGKSGLGLSRVRAGFIADLKRHFPQAGPAEPSEPSEPTETEAMFSEMFSTLDIPETVAAAVMDIFRVFADYRAFSARNGLIDEEDLLARCPGYIRQNYATGSRKYTLVLDGFYDPDPAEMKALAALIEHAAEAFISLPSEPQFSELTRRYRAFLREHFSLREERIDKEVPHRPERLHYYAYADVEEEVEGIARHIKSSFLTGRIKRLEEVTVAFPELRTYAAMVERVFRRYGIPFTSSRKKSLAELRPFLDLLCLIRSVTEGYPRLKFSQFLSSRFFPALPETLRSWIPPLSLQSGIIAGKEAWLEFVAEGSETVDIRLLPEREEIEKGLKWVFRRLRPLEELGEGAPLGRWAEVLGKLLDALGFPGQRTDETVKALYEKMQEVLAQLSFIGTLHTGAVAPAEAEEILRHLLEAVSLEAEEQGVRVAGFSDTAGLTPRYLYFGGLSDGALPKRPDMEYLLPDSAKKRMGLLYLEKYNALQKFEFTGLVAGSGHYHLSYPLMDGDALFLPSSFLYGGEELRERIPGIFSRQEQLLLKGGGALLGQLGEVRVPPAQLRLPSALRVTDIDAYRACPRRFFIERILKLQPLGIKEYEIEAATLGTVVHRIMEKLIQGPLGSLAELRQRAEAIVEEVLGEKKMSAYWRGLIADTFLEMLPALHERERELREEGYTPSALERNISGEPLKGIKLRGKIDRIDTAGDEVQILDYKTGAAGLNCAQALAGNEGLQLFLYAAILKHHGYRLSRVGIYSLKDMNIKWCPPKGRAKKRSKGNAPQEPGPRLDDYLSVALQSLETAVAGIRKGDFSAAPLNDTVCWNCHEYAFCPYIQQ